MNYTNETKENEEKQEKKEGEALIQALETIEPLENPRKTEIFKENPATFLQIEENAKEIPSKAFFP